jgi:hypothetical protein
MREFGDGEMEFTYCTILDIVVALVCIDDE